MTDITRRDLLKGALALAAIAAAAPLMSKLASAQAALTISVFDARETQAIRDYYRMQVEKARANRGKGGGVPPGMPRKDELPPGLQRQIRANATLPPGIAKKGLPAELERSLPIRVGTVRLIAGDQVILVDAKNTIRDLVDLSDILDRLYGR